MSLYHISWREITISRDRIKISSFLPFISPILISYSEFKTVKCTGYLFSISFENIKKKLKLGLIFPWAEFLTITVSSNEVERAVEAINHNKNIRL